MNVYVEAQYDHGRRSLTIVTSIGEFSYAATMKDVDSIEAGNALTDYVKMLRQLGADVIVPGHPVGGSDG